MQHGFSYQVAIMDWYSRHVQAWTLTNSQAADICIEVYKTAPSKARPLIFHSDQGSQ